MKTDESKIKKAILISTSALGLTLVMILTVMAVKSMLSIRPPEQQVINIYLPEETSAAKTSAPSQSQDAPEIPDLPIFSVPDEYAAYYAENGDMVGWLEIPGIINTPVVRTDNNEAYLTKRFDGSVVNYSDAAFEDFRCGPDSKTKIIYGHNLLSGEGFAPMTNYYPWKRDASGSVDFASGHSLIRYHNFYNNGQSEYYAVFAAICVTADPNDKYYIDPAGLATASDYESAFKSLMPEILDRSSFYVDNLSISPGDDLLILSTCIDILGHDYETRFMVFARRLRPDENPDNYIPDISLNPDPLYFKAYYDIMGTEWNGRTWDGEKLLS